MLAIVIPYYKFNFFEATLESLASQTDQRFKVYIGDDASPESPVHLLENYKGKFEFVYHRFEENLGGISLTQQWGRCIALSGDEEWIMVLGDDDYLDENVIASWYKHYNLFCNDSNIIRFATKIVNEVSVVISNAFLHPEFETAGDSWYRKFKGQTRSSLSEYIFSEESYRQFGFKNYPLAWHSDDRAWLDFSNEKPIYTINKSKVYIRVSTINISGKNDNIVFKNIASIQFLRDLLKLKLFNKKQILEIMYFYEAEIKKSRKLSLSEWLFLSKMYCKNIEFVVFGKFIRRLLIAFFT